MKTKSGMFVKHFNGTYRARRLIFRTSRQMSGYGRFRAKSAKGLKGSSQELKEKGESEEKIG
jgi:hypothetical protein